MKASFIEDDDDDDSVAIVLALFSTPSDVVSATARAIESVIQFSQKSLLLERLRERETERD